METTTLLYIIGGVLVLVGLVGTVLPALPGAPFVFLGLLSAAWADQFQKVGLFTIIVLGVITLLTLGIDFVATALGAKKVGASKLAVIGAALGTLGGLVFGIIGLIVGPFVGAVAGQLIDRGGNLQNAGKVGFGTWLGLLVGTLAKLTLVFAMIGIFITAYLIGK